MDQSRACVRVMQVLFVEKKFEHNEAVRAMRYPPNAHKKSKEDALSRKDRASAEAEIAQAMMDDEDDF